MKSLPEATVTGEGVGGRGRARRVGGGHTIKSQRGLRKIDSRDEYQKPSVRRKKTKGKGINCEPSHYLRFVM